MAASLSALVLNYNDAPMLALTLPPLKRCVDEIVVVDMESTDGSHALFDTLLGTRDKVVTYPRAGLFSYGFSHPRNYGACFAASDWLITVDSDELVVPEEIARFRNAAVDAQSAYSVLRRNYRPDEARGIHDLADLIAHGAFHEETHCRIVRNTPRIRWEGLIHEELWDGDEKASHHYRPSGVTLHHLSGFKHDDGREKLKLYHYLTLKAVTFPRFRYGTNDFWFDDFARAHMTTMIEHADAFCADHGLPKLPRA